MFARARRKTDGFCARPKRAQKNISLVIRDYKNKKVALSQVNADVELDDQNVKESVRTLLDAELKQDKEARDARKVMMKAGNALPAREANKEMIQIVDHGMFAVRGQGLNLFVTGEKIEFHRSPRDTLIFEEVDSVWRGSRRRAIVEDAATGERRWLLKEDMDESPVL